MAVNGIGDKKLIKGNKIANQNTGKIVSMINRLNGVSKNNLIAA